ncbi:hypothetical protein ASPWEDRAFT_176531 [Aspergillus wentii DTO 134E9]|uniref:BZIP domain-containing protein n=1 Tax=Aspergillus wentii DTO 134E9 TaxID=1073089 RepID=A0A1L9R9A1_ASPWE|nr:uncharacterized protein ASPWEDRAFT_176531 [Aspergillus wentii DTO 134E9]KAI9926497.1 hypothetical protein MW887_004262 [Aspergillus wentii]OJJ31463.1 hypothetical protein ASPWEDRAFT_176531 [Aspergillus wentii DTO 134E9]
MSNLNGGGYPLEHGLRAQPSQASMKASIGSDFLKIFSGNSGNSGSGGGSGNGGQKKVTRDGQPAKRRGPKPDSKPAMTRRQELNRQAQRTHRERKEQYMRALETEVSRLREAYTQEISTANISLQQHKQMVHALMDETDILKDILRAHGISFDAELERRKAERPPPGYQSSPLASSSIGSQTAGAAPSNSNHFTATPPTTISSGLSPRVNGPEAHIDVSPTQDFSPQTQICHNTPSELPAFLDRSGSDGGCGPVQAIRGVFETDPQLQVDFILTLESPCREHTDYLCRRSITEADDEDMPFSGHALMASCPPPSYIANTTHEQAYPHKTYDLPHANLTTLLNLSRQLVTEGQITPIMALQCLKSHEMYRKLTKDDVKIIIETLNTKVRCYGFGAVVEDFEMMDCLSSVLGTKLDTGFSNQRDDLMYS